MPKPGFYAVQGGPKPGVYRTWDEAKQYGQGHPGARVKKFTTNQEAASFAAVPAASVPSRSAAAPNNRAGGAQTSGSAESKSTAAAPSLKRGRMGATSSSASSLEQLLLYTDGSCRGNRNVATTTNPAGWGVLVVRLGELEPLAELYGPVVTDAADPFYIGAEVCSNNTGELSAVCEALRWIKNERSGARVEATIRYDSKYAANIASGRHKAHANIRLAARANMLYKEVHSDHVLVFEHVKGHSGEEWNERADLLANWGAEGRRSETAREVMAPVTLD